MGQFGPVDGMSIDWFVRVVLLVSVCGKHCWTEKRIGSDCIAARFSFSLTVPRGPCWLGVFPLSSYISTPFLHTPRGATFSPLQIKKNLKKKSLIILYRANLIFSSKSDDYEKSTTLLSVRITLSSVNFTLQSVKNTLRKCDHTRKVWKTHYFLCAKHTTLVWSSHFKICSSHFICVIICYIIV